jgi:bifunctional DNA-binding transcriptional regulator/antitoxin component of YhaV-PrlF toxin-antitoxin module
MAIFIQKISDSGGQYRVTLPKLALKEAGLEKARVVEIWVTEESIIHIKEYHAKKRAKRRVPARRAKTN